MGRIQLRTQLQPRGPAAAVVLDDAQVAEVGEGATTWDTQTSAGDIGWLTLPAR